MRPRPMRVTLAVVSLIGCTGPTEGRVRTPFVHTDDSARDDSDADADDSDADDSDTDADTDSDSDVDPGPCPADMVAIDSYCIDKYEAPNVPGGLPFVMYHYYEARSWCEARGKRLCFDDEWQRACEGTARTPYPYGDTHRPGVCNDEETWRTYSQSSLSAWPGDRLPTDDFETVAELFDAARALSPSATAHVEWLYQAEGAGTNPGCGGEFGVYDLSGNVEEWTTRRDGGDGRDFSGNLKGRYWAESRTCQSNVKSHGNAFRFYEIGFRCCMDP